jgi:hypothetical protein
MIILGDMHVVGQPPAKLLKAMAVIADTLHPAYDAQITPENEAAGDGRIGGSKTSCIFSSLAACDFLRQIGFKRARVTTCYLFVRSYDAEGAETYSLAVGDHDQLAEFGLTGKRMPDSDTHWSGHMVCEVDGWVIDATMYQCQRPAFDGMPGMMALEIGSGMPVLGLQPLAGVKTKGEQGSMMLMWLRQRNRRWQESLPDVSIVRRAKVVRALVQKFGHWRG